MAARGQYYKDLTTKLQRFAPFAVLSVEYNVEVGTKTRLRVTHKGVETERRGEWRLAGDPTKPPAHIITSLDEQLQTAINGMESFYAAALDDIAPELVLNVLSGTKTDMRAQFERRMRSAEQELQVRLETSVGQFSGDGWRVSTERKYTDGHVQSRLTLNAQGGDVMRLDWGGPMEHLYYRFADVKRFLDASIKASAALKEE